MSSDTSTPVTTGSQFSLRSLMIGITVFCVLCALVAIPPILALLTASVGVALAGMLALTVWKGRGWCQAFAVGAIAPHVAGIFAMFNTSGPIEATFLFLAVELVACIAGVGSAAYHGFLIRRQGKLPVPNLPFIRKWFTNEMV